MISIRKAITAFLFATILSPKGYGRQVADIQESIASSVAVSDERLRRIDQLIENSIGNKEIAGAVAFVARDGRIVYNKAFGFSDLIQKTPLRNDHIFRIASQTKAITSVAVMMLFEEGRILLDDPISKYIPAFSRPVVLDKFNSTDSSYTIVPANREITIRDLLTHTSGIDYAVIGTAKMKAIYAKAGIPVGFEGGNLLLKDAINKLGSLPLAHHPGERFTYGLNTDILARLVEVVSGISLDKFFVERIFKPLEMNDTYFFLPASKHSRLVSIHTYDAQNNLIRYAQEGALSANYPLRKGTYFSGGAGLSSTITDYGSFLQMLLNKGMFKEKRVLARKTVDLMIANQIGDLQVGGDKFGLGFRISSKQSEAKLGMSEGSFSWGGYFGTTFWVDPKERLVCMIFSQQSPLKSDLQDKFRAAVYQALSD